MMLSIWIHFSTWNVVADCRMKNTKLKITSGKAGALATCSFEIPVSSVIMGGIGLGGLTNEWKVPFSTGVASGAKIFAAISITWWRSLENPVVSRSKIT